MATSGSSAHLRMLISIATLILLLRMRTTQAEVCIWVAGYDQRWPNDLLKCMIMENTEYADIANDTNALWVIYPEGNAVRDTFAQAHPSMPYLEILITDVTYLNETDFEPGAFENSDMPRLETVIIERDLSAAHTLNTGYLLLDDSFLGLDNLRNLYLESLGMIELELNSLRGLENLEKLSLKQNYMTYILPNTLTYTPNLTSLSLHDNYIENLHDDAFAGLESLTRLDLSLNSFTELKSGPFSHLSNLETLDLSNNQIATIETNTFQGLTKLHYLALNSNDLFEISMDIFEHLASLETLILESNEIQLQPNLFSHLTNLRHLSMSNNAIIRIEPSHWTGLGALTGLFLSNNLLDTLHNDTFAGLSNLTQLDLDENLIATIEPNAFHGLNNLAQFSIEGNQLASIPESAFAPFSRTLDTIYVHENPWVCDCDIQWFIVWIRERYDELEPEAQWSYVNCNADDLIPNVSFFTLIHDEQYLNAACGPFYLTTSVTQPVIETTMNNIEAISTTDANSDTMDTTTVAMGTDPPIIAQSSTIRVVIPSTTTVSSSGGNDKHDDKDNEDDGLFASNKLSTTDIVILVFLLFGAILVVIVIMVCILHRKKRKNRMWLPPDGRPTEKERNELVDKAQTPVPSFYPDPDQTHGGATFEGDTQDGGGIEAEVTSETTSDTSALTPAAPSNGGIKIQHAYLNAAMATDSTESLSTAFRDRKSSMQSADSIYTYEGEYYKDGYDRPDGLSADRARISAVSMTPSGTPQRVRTISASSLDRKRHHSDGSGVRSNRLSNNNNTTDSQFHSLGSPSVRYADIRVANGNSNGNSNENSAGSGHPGDTRYHVYKSSSAESDDPMLPAQNVLYSQGTHNNTYAPVRTDISSPENSASSAIELKPLTVAGSSSQARPLKVVSPDLNYIEVEKDLSSPTYNQSSQNSGTFFGERKTNGNSDRNGHGRSPIIQVRAQSINHNNGPAGSRQNGANHVVLDSEDVDITL